MVPSDIGAALDIPPSSLSHHLDKLKNEALVNVRRDNRFLWYTANTAALQELLGFLYAECCTRNKAIAPECVIEIRKSNKENHGNETSGARKVSRSSAPRVQR